MVSEVLSFPQLPFSLTWEEVKELLVSVVSKQQGSLPQQLWVVFTKG